MSHHGVTTVLILLATTLTGLLPAHAASEPKRHGMAVRLAACAACHGKQGQGGLGRNGGVYPRLAGQPPGYLYAQMRRFKDRTRAGIPPVAIMQRLLNPLPDAYLHSIARYYSGASPPYPPRPRLSAADRRTGRGLVNHGLTESGIGSCTRCHGGKLLGRSPDVPALAGQYPLYLQNQFAHWIQGERDNALHKRIAEALSPRQLRSLVRYLASLRPGKRDRPTDGHRADSNSAGVHK